MLSRRAGFSLVAAVALAISLGIKALAPGDIIPLNVERYDRELVALLAAQAFAAGIEDRPYDWDIVAAQRGSCRLKARLQYGLDSRSAFRHFAQDLPVLKYRYRGTYLDDFPRGGFELRNRIQSLGLRFGLTHAVELPLLIAASPECELSKIDFGPQLLLRLES
jgi:hypothetical protein